jgi:hypothetical protein
VVCFEEAATFKFHNDDFWGWREAYENLIKTGASVNCIGEDWVKNHFKHIVWKFSRNCQKYPKKCNMWWSTSSVMDQLLFR